MPREPRAVSDRIIEKKGNHGIVLDLVVLKKDSTQRHIKYVYATYTSAVFTDFGANIFVRSVFLLSLGEVAVHRTILMSTLVSNG